VTDRAFSVPAITIADADAEALACRLDGLEQAELMDAYAALAREALVSISRDGPHLELVFRRSAAATMEARRIVKVESHCCPFMTIDESEPEVGQLMLRYTGGQIIEPILDMIEGRIRGAQAST
jgi:hypothetical protein